MTRNLTAMAFALASAALPVASIASDDVARAIQETARESNKISVCVALSKAMEQTTRANEADKKKAIEQINTKLKLSDPLMLRARGDVARKGLYRYPVDQAMALRMYERAQKSQEGGWNAALMLYGSYRERPNPQVAQRIKSLLTKSGAAASNAKGPVSAQAHYMAGLLSETGATGVADEKAAFLHYRASARNAYIPGAYHYMRLLTQTLPKLTEGERAVAMQEIRMMTNRWKWQSPEIMMLTGDMHSSRLLPDEDGFNAQYHWRMAMRMATRLGGVTETNDFEGAMRQRIKPLTAELDKRLEEAVEAGLKNATSNRHELEYAELCVE